MTVSVENSGKSILSCVPDGVYDRVSEINVILESYICRYRTFIAVIDKFKKFQQPLFVAYAKRLSVAGGTGGFPFVFDKISNPSFLNI